MGAVAAHLWSRFKGNCFDQSNPSFLTDLAISVAQHDNPSNYLAPRARVHNHQEQSMDGFIMQNRCSVIWPHSRTLHLRARLGVKSISIDGLLGVWRGRCVWLKEQLCGLALHNQVCSQQIRNCAPNMGTHCGYLDIAPYVLYSL